MVNYSRLWHLLLDKNLKKTQLCENAGISSSTLAKLGKDEFVSTDVLCKICDVLGCSVGDIMDMEKDENEIFESSVSQNKKYHHFPQIP